MTVPPPLLAFTDAEETVALARIRVERLTAALLRTPINREVYAELTAFLEDFGWRACDAMDDLTATGPAAQADRIVELLTGTEYDPRRAR